jgi:hypothetical protein
MNFLSPYLGIAKAIALIAAALALFGAGHHFGAQGVQADWSKETADRKTAETAAILIRIKNNEREIEQQESNRQKLKKGHANEIAQIRAAYATDRGLRLPATVCRGLAAGTEAESASRGNGSTAGTVALPDQVERDLRALMLEADTVVAGCRVAQAFIRDNGMAP